MKERFLADENFPASIAARLRNTGHDVKHVADEYAGIPDTKLLRIAVEEDRIILTFDRDFGELIFLRRVRGVRGIVLFRFGKQSRRMQRALVDSFFAASPPLSGFFTVVSPGRYRQTKLKA